MQLQSKGTKPNSNISSVARNASCSHGWLRVVMQYIFGAITVFSFILIVIMAIGNNHSSHKASLSRCKPQGCRVVCVEAPYFGRYEEDIIYSVAHADMACDRVILTLNNPRFTNGTLPANWLSRMRVKIYELEIVGGNLLNIAPQAFMNEFTSDIRRLSLVSITIALWCQEMLIGLSKLDELNIQNSYIGRIERNAIESVDDTLKTLSITSSGYWDPVNLTGFANLEVLNSAVLSMNIFNNILQRDSFQRLYHCKILFLNSCRISALGPGTFDNLQEIQVIYLNNNFLKELPAGIFDNIVGLTNPRPRINLLDNLWNCHCSNNDLRKLTTAGLLLVEPTCHNPQNVQGYSFSQFERYCNNHTNHTNRDLSVNPAAVQYINDFYMPENCYTIDTYGNNNISTTYISPVQSKSCTLTTIGSSRSFWTNKPQINDIIQAILSMKGEFYSMLQLTSSGEDGYGLMWYQEKCPHEIYCISEMPIVLRVYNVNDSAEYTFCPISLSSGEIVDEKCIFYSFVEIPSTTISFGRLLWYIFTVILCLLLGAFCLYAVIRKFPNLLKGSNRILFVKHKNVDALILPPKVPLRSSLVNDDPIINFNDKDIFTLSDKHLSEFTKYPFVRSKSTRSGKSMAPSYISALQPTEEQLTEWRLRHHFDNDTSLTSISFNVPYALIADDESMYCSISLTSNNPFESLK